MRNIASSQTTCTERARSISFCVSFDSGSDRCVAWLYLPEGPQPHPVIVMAHGLGAVKALRLGAFAERFQAAGYACLVFDYRYFGDSEGEPRELLSIRRQREDWRAAVSLMMKTDGARASSRSVKVRPLIRRTPIASK